MGVEVNVNYDSEGEIGGMQWGVTLSIVPIDARIDAIVCFDVFYVFHDGDEGLWWVFG